MSKVKKDRCWQRAGVSKTQEGWVQNVFREWAYGILYALNGMVTGQETGKRQQEWSVRMV